jgi:hypothetical protein
MLTKEELRFLKLLEKKQSIGGFGDKKNVTKEELRLLKLLEKKQRIGGFRGQEECDRVCSHLIF